MRTNNGVTRDSEAAGQISEGAEFEEGVPIPCVGGVLDILFEECILIHLFTEEY